VARIRTSFQATVAAQTDEGLENHHRGFFLIYVNSWNEWHEGHSFGPMRDSADLTPAERTFGYRNPANGRYRLDTLRDLVRGLGNPHERPAVRPAVRATRAS